MTLSGRRLTVSTTPGEPAAMAPMPEESPATPMTPGKPQAKGKRRRCPPVVLVLWVWLVTAHGGLAGAAPLCPGEGYGTTGFEGKVKAGETYERAFGCGFRLILEPQPHGWLLVIRDRQGDEDLSRLTPPFHFVPNPREIAGWHFRNSDNTGPNEAGDKNVNAPGTLRDFIFSPAVGRTIDGPAAGRKPTAEEIDAVRSFGCGRLRILDYRLSGLEPDTRARLEWMRFAVDLWWREADRCPDE